MAVAHPSSDPGVSDLRIVTPTHAGDRAQLIDALAAALVAIVRQSRAAPDSDDAALPQRTTCNRPETEESGPC